MKTNKILRKIKSGEVKMKPKWEFEMVKWGEVGIWLGAIGVTVLGILGIIYFMTIYKISELQEFGDIGWQIFYEDFPYVWVGVAIISLIIGILVMLNFGTNYKRSWQKNLIIMLGIILIITIVVSLFLRF